MYNSSMLRLNQAKQAWDLGIHDRALELIDLVLAEFPFDEEALLLKIKWSIVESHLDNALKSAWILWDANSSKIAGNTLSAVAKLYCDNQHKGMSFHLLKMVCQYYLEKMLKNDIELFDTSQSELKKIVWQCWFQGEDKAPDLVLECMNSVKKYWTDYEHILITEQNFMEYVDIPKYLLTKYRAGIISKAHFSDIIRCRLLSQYGGVWIDGTVLFTNNVPREILESDFFVFQTGKDKGTSNWFILSKARHPLIEYLGKLIESYWGENDDLVNYFLMHGFLVKMVENDSRFSDLFDKIPFFSNEIPHRLDSAFKLGWGKEEMLKLKMGSFIHKLSWKEPINFELIN